MRDQKLANKVRWLKNRRSQRIGLNVPVVVYPLPNGALLVLTDMVTPKQRVLVLNTHSEELEECRVVYVKNELTGPPKVALEFTRPAPSFWHLAFPPADWTGSV
jgi:hypothetical protein